MKHITTNLSTGLLLAVLAFAAMTQAIAQEYTFTTLAGLAGVSGSADGTGTAARFYFPVGVAVDGRGNLLVGGPMGTHDSEDHVGGRGDNAGRVGGESWQRRRHRERSTV